MKKTLLVLTAILSLGVAQANATWFYYDNHNGGWTYYGYYPDGAIDQTFYFGGLGACAQGWAMWDRIKNQP